MPSKVSRALVIDASVARSAGAEEATYPTSKHCRDFLKACLTLSHQVVMSTPINDEWNKHKSAFARTWLVSMVARKRVLRINIPEDTGLRQAIQKVAESQKDCDAMLKDCHLLEAAVGTERTVIALDETVRALFKASCQTIGAIRTVVWVNPTREEEQAIPWLEKGAAPEKHRQLGFQPEQER